MFVPARLPQLPAGQTLATVELPLTLNRSEPGRMFRLIDRGDRAPLYETVLGEGAPFAGDDEPDSTANPSPRPGMATTTPLAAAPAKRLDYLINR